MRECVEQQIDISLSLSLSLKEKERKKEHKSSLVHRDVFYQNSAECCASLFIFRALRKLILTVFAHFLIPLREEGVFGGPYS